MFVNLPLANIHPNATRAAEAAICASQQGKFSEFHDRLFVSTDQLVRDALEANAAAVGLNLATYRECLGDSAAKKLRDQMALAKQLGVTGTPATMVGIVTANDELQVLSVLRGARPLSEFSEAIEQARSRAKGITGEPR